MTPAEHRARAEAIASLYDATGWEQREAARAQPTESILDLPASTAIGLGQLHALLSVRFVDPHEIISVSTDPDDSTPQVWEKCKSCGHEYAYPHLCREHMLCGPCHPALDPKAVR